MVRDGEHPAPSASCPRGRGCSCPTCSEPGPRTMRNKLYGGGSVANPSHRERTEGRNDPLPSLLRGVPSLELRNEGGTLSVVIDYRIHQVLSSIQGGVVLHARGSRRGVAGRLKKRRSSRLSECLVLAVIAAMPFGCQKSLFLPNEPRTQYDRYQRARSELAPQYLENEYGVREPNLRERLGPK